MVLFLASETNFPILSKEAAYRCLAEKKNVKIRLSWNEGEKDQSGYDEADEKHCLCLTLGRLQRLGMQRKKNKKLKQKN